MYPFVRLAKELVLAKRAGPLGLWDTHVSYTRCWPWDIDFAMELNNGRTLTLMDLSRIPLAFRTGLARALFAQKWQMTMAGVSVRYRRRVRPFEKVSIQTRALGHDARFLYLEQAMVKRSGETAHHALYRVAVTDRDGIVAPDRVLEAMGCGAQKHALPDWVTAWIEADKLRPWPPMTDATGPLAQS